MFRLYLPTIDVHWKFLSSSSPKEARFLPVFLFFRNFVVHYPIFSACVVREHRIPISLVLGRKSYEKNPKTSSNVFFLLHKFFCYSTIPYSAIYRGSFSYENSIIFPRKFYFSKYLGLISGMEIVCKVLTRNQLPHFFVVK